MTKLDRPVVRETGIMIRDGGKLRPLVVSLERAGLVVRLKGQRYQLLLPYEMAWARAGLLEAERLRRERRQKRAA